MNIVLDSNIIFTFFWKNSIFETLFSEKNHSQINFFAPNIAKKELEKYQFEIQEKTKISSEEFNKKKEELYSKIHLFSEKEYSKEIQIIIIDLKKLNLELADAILEDIDFLALALEKNTILWSNEKRLKKQSIIEVLNTQEIIELLN